MNACSRHSARNSASLLAACLCLSVCAEAANNHHRVVQGMLLEVDPAARSITVSCEAIPGYMDAMVMPFEVRDARSLKALRPGLDIRFTMVAQGSKEYAEHLQIVDTANHESEPTQAGQLAVLDRALDPASAAKAIPIGKPVPDFTLTDQLHQTTSLSQLKGKVVAITFAYSRCPNPNYCFRLSNNLFQLSRRFKGDAGRDLALITIVIDPANDQGKGLEQYAETWKADPAIWRFLTGPVETIRGIAQSFGMNFWSDEGFLIHSFHTVVIDRQGRLAANLDGNQFSAKQLGDLVQTVLEPKPRISASLK